MASRNGNVNFNEITKPTTPSTPPKQQPTFNVPTKGGMSSSGGFNVGSIDKTKVGNTSTASTGISGFGYDNTPSTTGSASRGQSIPTVATGGGTFIESGPVAGSGVVPLTPQGEDKTDYDYAIEAMSQPQNDPTFERLRYMTAKDFLDANVMAQISNEIARKNMRSDLSSLGLENSGYAGTASALRENANQAQLMRNQANYQEALRDIEYQERTAEQSALAQQASNISSNISQLNGDARDEYLRRSGLVQDSNGRWVNGKGTNYTDVMLNGINDAYFVANNPVSGENEANAVFVESANFADLSAEDRDSYLKSAGLKYENGRWVNGTSNFTNEQLARINNAYVWNNAVSTMEEEQATPAFSSLDDFLNGSYVRSDGKAAKFGDHFSLEMKLIWARAVNNEYKAGDVIKVTNGMNDTVYIKVNGTSGVSYSTKEEYDNAVNDGKGRDIIYANGRVNEVDPSNEPKSNDSSQNNLVQETDVSQLKKDGYLQVKTVTQNNRVTEAFKAQKGRTPKANEPFDWDGHTFIYAVNRFGGGWWVKQ